MIKNFAIISLLLCFALVGMLFAQTSDEIKSAFILLFADNVEWNDNTSEEFTIGVQARDSVLYNSLQNAAQNKTIYTKPVIVLHVNKPEDISGLRILYVDKGHPADFDELNRRIKGKQILLITDNMTKMAMVNFEIIDKSVKFDMDEAAINAESMTVSPELLQYYEKQATQNWQNLYSVTHKMLEGERRKLQELSEENRLLEENIDRQKKINKQIAAEIGQKEKDVSILNAQIKAQKDELTVQSLEIENQKTELSSLTAEINEKEQAHTQNIRKLETEAETYQNEVDKQKSRLKLQLSKIHAQRTIILLSVLFICLVTVLVAIEFKAYHDKKKANVRLEQKNIAINEQKEKIQAQAHELQITNEKLIELDHFKQRMTSMIVHDLKNPLNIILSGLSTHSVQPQIDKLQNAARQMLNMVMNILDVQKFEDTRMILETRNHSLSDVAKMAVEQVSFLGQQKNITIHNLISSQITVKIDPEIVERIFVNLLTNGIKYTSNNGEINLSVNSESFKKSSGFTRIEVTDTGEGIPADKLDQVFEKFNQVRLRSSGRIRSTGLGLTFCKLAIEAHGGIIGVNSDIGKGAMFWFTLPESKPGEEPVIRESSTVIENQHYSLTEKDNKILNPVIKKLRNYEVYEISSLQKILKQIDSSYSDGLKIWKEELLNTIYSGNKDRFHELLE